MPNRTARAADLAVADAPTVTSPTVTAAPAAETPAVLAGVTVSAEEVKAARDAATVAREAAKAAVARARELAKTAKATKTDEPKITAATWRRDVDAKIIEEAGKIVTATVPQEFQAEVAQLIANQLHHLATPKTGWPGSLPKPARSEWT